MKTKKIISALLLTTILLSSCKKYEDGPAISLRSKKARVEGSWDLTLFTINNENGLSQTYTDTYNCSSSGSFIYTEEYKITSFIWTFKKEGGMSYTAKYEFKLLDQATSNNLCNDYYEYTTEDEVMNGKWKFLHDKEKIELTIDGEATTLDIKELKNDVMRFAGSSGGDNYVMLFESR